MATSKQGQIDLSGSPQAINPPGDSDNPMDQWCHIAETVNMLYLAVCQIEATLQDSNSSVNTLTQAFMTMASHTEEFGQNAQQLKEIKDLEQFKDDIAKTTKEMRENISNSVQAFQFYDRVCQRIDHVARSLEEVSKVLSDTELLKNPDAWELVQTKIKSSYTMEAERIMFEFIMRGGSVREALEIYQHHFDKNVEDKPDSDEIELF